MRERANPNGANFYPPLFPSPTAGDGMVVANNLRTGSRQPDAAPSPLRKVSCKICGFFNSLHRVAPSGGDLEGNGAFAGNTLSGSSDDGDLVGEGNLQVGSGCCLCGSKNFSASGAGI